MRDFDNYKNIFMASLFALLIIVFSGCGEKVTTIAGGELSNVSHGWGFKKVANAKPEQAKEYEDLLSNNGGIWVGDGSEPVLYLTFDCGYEAGHTAKILDVLKEEGVPAAFFVTGHFVESVPQIIKRMVDEGHIVGNHTLTHIDMPKSTDEKIKADLDKLYAKYQEVAGEGAEMKYMRPPGGEFSERTLKLAKDLGYTNVFWSNSYVDWDGKHEGDHDWVFGQMEKQYHNGAIILLHNTSKNNADILGRFIQDAKSRGFTFKSLDEFR